MSERTERYVAQIRRDGAALSRELAGAFASVPRETFIADGFLRREGGWVKPGDAEFLDTVYSDDVLVTKVDGKVPVSSSSQPSLMAIMLMALDVRPGLRVLEIGAGTGYNAALLAALGSRVTSVDVQADVADRARAALARAGVDGVRVLLGDGYAGAPGERFDRVIVTVGVAGLSPQWLAQLDGAGPIVIPVEHAGTHPVLVVTGEPGGPVTASVLCASGFMSAAGPLSAAHAGSHPAPAAARTLADFTPAAGPRWRSALTAAAYRDLWYAAGVWSRRATHAAVPGWEQSLLALLDPSRAGGAVVLPDGTVLAAGTEGGYWADEAIQIIDRWESIDRPPMQAWRIGLSPSGDPDTPIWVPTTWDL
jgi:protein-L-isoaspartate(D-aspartate) O-methyltransferase